MSAPGHRTGPGWLAGEGAETPEGADPVRAWLGLAIAEHPGPGGHPARVMGTAPLDAPLVHPDGHLALGALAALVDTVGGLTCGLSLLPDWVVTSTLTLELLATSWGLGGSDLQAEGTLLHGGRRQAAAQVLLGSLGVPEALAVGLVSSARVPGPDPGGHRLPRPLDQPAPPRELGRPLQTLEALDQRRQEPGQVVVELAPALRNPLGILHGGLTAVLVEAAARQTIQHPAPLQTRRLTVRYLVPATTGPIRATGVLGIIRPGAWTVRVAVTDEGQGNRQVATGNVTLVGPVASQRGLPR